MMARTKKDRRTYAAGERGRNRVRVFPDPKTGIYQIEWRERGRRCSESLGHRDFDKAKRQADGFAANYVAPEPEAEQATEPIALGQLFEMYLEEVTPKKSHYTQKHDRRAVRLFTTFFGKDRAAASLNRRDWDAFIDARRSGRLRPDGSRNEGGARNRTIEQNLQFIRAVMNWALIVYDSRGEPLLDRNPFQGFPLPKEKNPVRATISEEEYRRLVAVAPEVDWRFEVALVLCHETGHRIGAVRQLRWSDIDFESDSIRWRGDTEKTGYEHETPMTAEARSILLKARGESLGIGDASVLPAPQDPSRCVSRHLARDWWRKAEKKAELEPRRGRGYHSLRRKFASELIHKPTKVLCELGGWKEPMTIMKCYQHPDQQQLREALSDRRRAANGPEQRE